MNYKRKKKSKKLELALKYWRRGMAKTNYRKLGNRKRNEPKWTFQMIT